MPAKALRLLVLYLVPTIVACHDPFEPDWGIAGDWAYSAVMPEMVDSGSGECRVTGLRVTLSQGKSGWTNGTPLEGNTAGGALECTIDGDMVAAAIPAQVLTTSAFYPGQGFGFSFYVKLVHPVLVSIRVTNGHSVVFRDHRTATQMEGSVDAVLFAEGPGSAPVERVIAGRWRMDLLAR